MDSSVGFFILDLENKNISLSISSPNNYSLMSLEVWHVANKLHITLYFLINYSCKFIYEIVSEFSSNLYIFLISTFDSVKVPVLSKHKFFTWAPSRVLWGSVPIIPWYLSRVNDKP